MFKKTTITNNPFSPITMAPRKDPEALLIWIDGLLTGRTELTGEPLEKLQGELKKWMSPGWIVPFDSES